MKKYRSGPVIAVPFLFIIGVAGCLAQTSPQGFSVLGTYDLSGKRTVSPQHFISRTRIIQHAPDGRRIRTDVITLDLSCSLAGPSDAGLFSYTCNRLTIKQGDALELPIPGLDGWTYVFRNAGIDEKGMVFGIDHGRFDTLTDGRGKVLPLDLAYHVYNAFIDFHAFCDEFAQPTPEGKGIQDLRAIGQRIIHASAFSKPPVNVGTRILEGSFFQNGEITLEFKGLGLVHGRPCALIGYDSGESSFSAIMKPDPNLQIQTTGSSHYFGDIAKDLETNWTRRVTMTEWVVNETILPGPPGKIHSVVERLLTIENISTNGTGR